MKSDNKGLMEVENCTIGWTFKMLNNQHLIGCWLEGSGSSRCYSFGCQIMGRPQGKS